MSNLPPLKEKLRGYGNAVQLSISPGMGLKRPPAICIAVPTIFDAARIGENFLPPGLDINSDSAFLLERSERFE